MKTFKEYFITEMAKKDKSKKKLPSQAELISNRGIGADAALALRKRKSGAHDTDKKKYTRKDRKEGKKISY